MTGGERRWTLTDALFLSLVAASTLPAVLVRYPLSADYLNHLARLHILASRPDAPIRRFYEIHWSLIPNLAVDLLGVVLRPIASPEAVMKGALIGTLVALGLSVWFLHRSLFKRTQPTLLLCAFCLLSLPITAGLINFAMGLPLVFLALGCWIRMGGTVSGRSILLLNVLGLAAYFAHIAVLGALALTIAAYHCFDKPLGVRAVLARAAQLIPGFLLPALLVIGAAIATWRGGTAHGGVSLALTTTKLFAPLAPFFTANTAADLALLCVTVAIVILCRGPMNARLKPVLLTWAIVIAAVPSSIGTAVFIDARLAIIPALLYLSSIAFEPQMLSGPALSALLTSLGIIRVLTLTASWQLHDAHVRSFRAMDDKVAMGARVIVATATPAGCERATGSWELLEEHLPSLLSVDRDAFVSTVFAGDGMQPIRWKLDMGGTALPNVIAPTFSALEKTAWRERYDYLILRDCVPQRTPLRNLLPVAHSDTYRIFKIVHPSTRSQIG